MRTLGGDFAEVGAAPANATSTEVSGLTPATGYVFRVQAEQRRGLRPRTPTRRPPPPTAPSAPAWRTPHRSASTTAASGSRSPGRPSPATTGVATAVPFALRRLRPVLVLHAEQLGDAGQGARRLRGATATTGSSSRPRTNVEFVVTVTDTQTGKVQVVLQPAGHPGGRGDGHRRLCHLPLRFTD